MDNAKIVSSNHTVLTICSVITPLSVLFIWTSFGSPSWRSFPNFFNVCERLWCKWLKAVLWRLSFTGICEERRRQGPSHPIMCLHRNSQHSNPNIIWHWQPHAIGWNFLRYIIFEVNAFSYLFFFLHNSRLTHRNPQKNQNILYFSLIMCGMMFWWVILFQHIFWLPCSF